MKSLYKHCVSFRKLQTHKTGYLQVSLSKNGKSNTLKIHRLVAQAFIPNPNKYTEVNHKDENKENNSVEILEWITHQENINYGTHNQRMSMSLTNHPHKSLKILQYDSNMKLIKIWDSINECKRFGFSSGNICSCCQGKRHTHKGYIWKYLDEKV